MGSKANLAERHGMSSSFFVQIFDFSVQKIKKYLDVFYQTTPCFFESSANSNKQNTPLTSIPPMVLLHQERINVKGVYLI